MLSNGQNNSAPELYIKMQEEHGKREKLRTDLRWFDNARCQLDAEERYYKALPLFEAFQASDAEYVRLHTKICEAHRIATFVTAKAASYQQTDGLRALAAAAHIDEGVEKSLERMLKRVRRSNALKSKAVGKFVGSGKNIDKIVGDHDSDEGDGNCDGGVAESGLYDDSPEEEAGGGDDVIAGEALKVVTRKARSPKAGSAAGAKAGSKAMPRARPRAMPKGGGGHEFRCACGWGSDCKRWYTRHKKECEEGDDWVFGEGIPGTPPAKAARRDVEG